MTADIELPSMRRWILLEAKHVHGIHGSLAGGTCTGAREDKAVAVSATAWGPVGNTGVEKARSCGIYCASPIAPAAAKASPRDPISMCSFGLSLHARRLRKYLAENALVDQAHVVEEGNPRVSDHLVSLGDKMGARVTIEGFARYAVGERTASAE